MRIAIDLHKDLIQMPLPRGISPVLVDTFFTDLGGEDGSKTVPPEADCFVADVDATFMQQVLNISKRKWKSDIHHHRQTDDLWARFEIAKWRSFGHD